MIKACIDQSRGTGLFGYPRRWLGTTLLVFGSTYLLAMVTRYVVRMSLYPPERWTGGAIPIFSHWVLAIFVLMLGFYHRASTSERTESPRESSHARKWLRRAAWLGGSLLVATGLALWIAYLLAPTLLVKLV